MSVEIHPTAQVDSRAELADGVSIGAFSIIGPNVRIGEGTSIGPHCIVDGLTTIGRNNRFYRFCSIGGEPQDKKYANEPTRLEIGDGNTVREYVTFNTGTVQDNGVTRIGSDNWIMAYVHVAHDCVIGNHTILANGVQLGGHVHIGDWAILGGLTGVHQFSKIGAHAMIGGNSSLMQDAPPYVLAAGNPCKPHGVNTEGLRRRGFDAESISALREAYKLVYRRGLKLDQALEALANLAAERPAATAAIAVMQDFLTDATRGVIRP
ncbi:acyl-ACP--UDP-N-acetylglucosamine O-acyltransferase [Kerstersia similis]|uniref:acyl-ACP--UDP-N-acetylglucosamine O-acyltransferase n=1 Tax=Kerstersia similis TaxID=206505 RepID=UPI0039EE4C8E